MLDSRSFHSGALLDVIEMSRSMSTYCSAFTFSLSSSCCCWDSTVLFFFSRKEEKKKKPTTTLVSRRKKMPRVPRVLLSLMTAGTPLTNDRCCFCQM